jgi:hypothetical protein
MPSSPHLPKDFDEERVRDSSFIRMRAEAPIYGEAYGDDEPPTLRARAPVSERPRVAGGSERDQLANEHVSFVASLLFLQRLSEIEPTQPFGGAAMNLVRTRVGELEDLRDALEAIQLAARDSRVDEMLAPKRPLAAFLGGIYLWTDGLMTALEDTAIAARPMRIDWFALKAAVIESSHFYFGDLFDPIRTEASRLDIDASNPNEPLRTFGGDLEDLFFTCGWLYESLSRAFGRAPTSGDDVPAW